MRRDLRVPIALLAAATFGLSACGERASTAAAAGGGTARPATSSQASAPVASAPAPPRTVVSADGEIVLEAFDFGFIGVPTTVAPGTRFTIKNISTSEAHEIVVYRLPDGDSRPVASIMRGDVATDPAFAADPLTLRVQFPSKTEVVTPFGDGTVTHPGRYVVYCKIPEKDTATPHYKKGMFAEFAVE